jgi:hypothetical protein
VLSTFLHQSHFPQELHINCPVLSLSDDPVKLGVPFHVVGERFAPGTEYSIYLGRIDFYQGNLFLGSVVADSSGSFSVDCVLTTESGVRIVGDGNFEYVEVFSAESSFVPPDFRRYSAGYLVYERGFDLVLSAGWNMVSFPVVLADTSFYSIFAGKGYYQVLTWTGTSYATPTIVEAGKGYWVLVLSATTISVEGAPVSNYSSDLSAGWSMIGSICDYSVNCASVFPSYYQMLTWSGTSYITSTMIEQSKGYWALVLSPTHITVG